jgi:amino acid transporter
MFVVVIFGLIGIEMSAIHAEDVANPKRDYPKAIAYSAILIVLSLVFSALAILVVVPLKQLSVVTGLISAYDLFFQAYDLQALTPVMAGLIVIGGLSGVSAWMMGPIRALSIAAHAAEVPKGIYKLNRFNAPYRMLSFQAIIFSLISLCFVYIPSVNAAYWWLSDACSQLALVVYLLMFAAFIKLRYSDPMRERVYRVPGKKLGMWLVAGTGMLCCIFGFLIGFITPSQIPAAASQLSLAMMVTIIAILIMIPFWLGRKHKRHQS